MFILKKIAVVYWSGTGNTKAMAELVAEGAKAENADVSIIKSSSFTKDDLENFDSIAFGCPSMGNEELEDSEFEPMFLSCENNLRSKKIALFGSYGWGDGEWMSEWEDLCKSFNAILVCNSVISCLEPDDEAEASCKEMGKALTKA